MTAGRDARRPPVARSQARALTDPRTLTGWRAVAHAFLGPSLPERADRALVRWEAAPGGSRELLVQNETARRVRLRGLLLVDPEVRVPTGSGWVVDGRIVVESASGPRSFRVPVLRRREPDVVGPGQVLRLPAPGGAGATSSAVLETRHGRQVWTWLVGPALPPTPLAARTTTSPLQVLDMLNLG